MLDSETLNLCKSNPDIRDLKIKNIEYAISQAEEIIRESNMTEEELIVLKKRINASRQELEILYLMKID